MSRRTTHQSININTALDMESDHNFYTGISENIREGGIFVSTFDPKPIGSMVLVRFKLPGNHPVIARGVVEFVKEDTPLLPTDQNTGMGVRFTNLMESDRKAIEKYLQSRNPLYYEQ